MEASLGGLDGGDELGDELSAAIAMEPQSRTMGTIRLIITVVRLGGALRR